MALIIAGTIAAASVGRAFYQIALTVTGGDNGFVTMFLLLIPVLTGTDLHSFLLGPSQTMHFALNRMFYVGLCCVGLCFTTFSLMSWRQRQRGLVER